MSFISSHIISLFNTINFKNTKQKQPSVHIKPLPYISLNMMNIKDNNDTNNLYHDLYDSIYRKNVTPIPSLDLNNATDIKIFNILKELDNVKTINYEYSNNKIMDNTSNLEQKNNDILDEYKNKRYSQQYIINENIKKFILTYE